MNRIIETLRTIITRIDWCLRPRTVDDFGADPTGKTPSDDAFMRAYHAAPPGAVVHIPKPKVKYWLSNGFPNIPDGCGKSVTFLGWNKAGNDIDDESRIFLEERGWDVGKRLTMKDYFSRAEKKD